MIFNEEKKLLEEGDYVIFFISPESLSTIQIKNGATINNRLGHFSLGKAIGQPFGYLLPSDCGKRKVALLRPTPDLWTRSLPHRTQILYIADISLIIGLLRIKPGTIVLESGTGSGSMTHALAKSVGDNGHVHTFEFHLGRAEQAKIEFAEHKLDSRVTIKHRDVCKEGFPSNINADAVFLDLPEPWEVIPKLKPSLKSGSTIRICCFSPCIEQVQKTCNALRLNGYSDIEMNETLLRNVEVIDSNFINKKRKATESVTLLSKYSSEARGHTSYLTFATLIQ